jgi:HlyD family secretion protein
MEKVLLLVVVAAAGLVWWTSDLLVRNDLFGVRAQPSEAQQGKAESPYITAPVERGEIRRTISATGTLNAIVNVEVGSQLSGQIARLFVDFNDEVKKGEALAELDQKSFKARVAEAQANMDLAEASIAVARARLERARIDSSGEARRSLAAEVSHRCRCRGCARRGPCHSRRLYRVSAVSLRAGQLSASTPLAPAPPIC